MLVLALMAWNKGAWVRIPKISCLVAVDYLLFFLLLERLLSDKNRCFSERCRQALHLISFHPGGAGD